MYKTREKLKTLHFEQEQNFRKAKKANSIDVYQKETKT